MATTSRNAARTLSARLRHEPQAFELLQALLVLEREQPRATSLGCGTSPQAEAIHLRGPLTPLFAASQVENLVIEEDGKARLTTPVFGLGGPDGPLPYAYQEWLQQRARAKDHAPAAFLDLFQHRLLSILYRVLRKHRIALGFTVPNASPVQDQLRALTGLLPKTLQERQALSDSAVLSRSVLFMGGRRSLAGFTTLVRQHFGQPIQASAYEGAWRSIPPASRSRLGRGARNLTLGRTAIAGTQVWDEHAGIRLTLGPLEHEQATRFLPDGEAHLQLASLASFYFGPDMDCSLSLLVKGAEPLSLTRGGAPRLRWNTGLQTHTSDGTYRIDTRLRTAEA
ncbi:type VI secretion system baseplate subunit TssG [Pseudomonas sp. GD03944]|uniref:type VI secretion system baseplate subunit TssG n=1 Tax=Pseudomonas sp. GD03944 TaxID=2975409 RepID=UPI002449CE0F|nr:type VI secretion system baseplate subunit TssG [Pseudomonas sp. GD03944]MDH1263703.1 type VI secretion system baseplate subunit TssG [Pseudomonas sp. GD03944]